MPLILALLLLLVIPAAAPAAVPRTISAEHDEITSLFTYGGTGVAWNWRDGDRAGSSLSAERDGAAVDGPPGLLDVRNTFVFVPDLFGYSHRGTLMVEPDGVVASGRRGVSDAHFTAEADGRKMLAWVERRRRIYASVAKTAEADFGPPHLLVRGRIRAMDFADDFDGHEGLVVWQNARHRLRVRIREGERRGGGFRAPVTIANPGERVSDLQVRYNPGGVTASILWSTSQGVFLARKLGREKRFPAPVRLGHEPATGLVITANSRYAWGTPGAVRIAYRCDDGFRIRTRAVAGTPHVDDMTNGLQAVYTLDGTVHFDGEALGPGHDGRIVFGNDVVWIDGGVVRRVTADTPEVPGGEFALDPCQGPS